MLQKTLLLSASYEAISFINYKKVIKLVIKDKVEIIENWDNNISWFSGEMKLPAILRLKNNIRINFFNLNFSRKSVIKRDNSKCQYCNIKLSSSQITIDHIIPRAQGGKTSFTNCVVSCKFCNNKKADRTPEEANMILLKKPIHPSFSTNNIIVDHKGLWHDDWNDYLLI